MISLLLLALAASALIFWAGWSFFHFTQPVPRYGGSYSEGIVGQPAYINPLLSQTSEADADLVQLIYSALFKYDGQGRITGDLAEKYEVSEDQKTYTVYLKKNAKWHDNEPLNAEDVVFKIGRAHV